VTLLDVSDLSIRYRGLRRPVVDSLSFSIAKGESVGLAGESGSGKTQTALAIMGLLTASASTSGSICYAGQELLGASKRELNKIRPQRIAMVFQDPGSALNPYLRIGTQLRRILLQHKLATEKESKERVIRMLARMDLPDPGRQYDAYPHQLSGGMRQRVMIASALLAEPELLIADEPTTAIDATVRAQILRLLYDLRKEMDMALLLITHDLGVIAGHCERVLVLEGGRLLEQGSTQRVFEKANNPRVRAMLEAVRYRPGVAAELRNPERKAVLEVEQLSVTYTVPDPDRMWGKKELVAVRPLDLGVRPGETLAIVGESGCGKTSLARAILGLISARTGSVSFFGRELSLQLRQRSNAQRRRMQLVFQEPAASLDPAMSVGAAITEPLKIHEPKLNPEERDERVNQMLGRVKLDRELLDRFPHELSGGQAQRAAIARALIIKPSLLICDEAVASLDGPVRQEVLALLAEEQRRTALSIIFISHDLDVVRQISHRVLVMYMGRVFEASNTTQLFAKPLHPYSRALIDCIAAPDPVQRPPDPPVQGEAPSLFKQPPGCVFHPRCHYAADLCRREAPPRARHTGAEVACHRATELDLTVAG